MHIEALAAPTRRTLERLYTLPGITDFYLAGGSAIALHVGHRFSHDLDWFSERRFDAKELRKNLERVGTLVTDLEKKDTLLGTLNGTKISFFYYQYPLLHRPARYEVLKIADLRDLVAMKVEAISGRGRRRDFVDLYTVMHQEGWDLSYAMGWFMKKYNSAHFNTVHILNSLIYFVDAEQDPELKMIKPVAWREVKRFFERQVKNFRL